jgi:putative transposase
VEQSDTHLFCLHKNSAKFYDLHVTDYRRNFITGGSYFFTANLADRRSSLLSERIDSLRRAFRYTRAGHPFTLNAIGVLPDHLHTIWTLPPGDSDFANRWRLIKTEFSRSLKPIYPTSASRSAKGERDIWQRRYWEHTLRDDADFRNHCNYIHFNAVKRGALRRSLRIDSAIPIVFWRRQSMQPITDRRNPASSMGHRTCKRTEFSR